MSILKAAPEGASILDLGAARAARAEARAAAGQGNPFLKLAVGYVEVLPEIPVGVAVDFNAGRIEEGLAGLLADKGDVAALIADGLTKSDMDAISDFITGSPLGESSASPKP